MSYSYGENKDIQKLVESLRVDHLQRLLAILKSPAGREELQDACEHRWQVYAENQKKMQAHFDKVVEEQL